VEHRITIIKERGKGRRKGKGRGGEFGQAAALGAGPPPLRKRRGVRKTGGEGNGIAT
jgi:hypothetical protein